MLPLLWAFSLEILQDVEPITTACASLSALYDVVRCLQRCKTDVAYGARLLPLQQRHMTKFQEAYGASHTRPKAHYALHLRAQMARLESTHRLPCWGKKASLVQTICWSENLETGGLRQERLAPFNWHGTVEFGTKGTMDGPSAWCSTWTTRNKSKGWASEVCTFCDWIRNRIRWICARNLPAQFHKLPVWKCMAALRMTMPTSCWYNLCTCKLDLPGGSSVAKGTLFSPNDNVFHKRCRVCKTLSHVLQKQKVER